MPWGNSQRYDFVVWMEGGAMYRVQVKGSGRLHRREYEVQPVHTTLEGGRNGTRRRKLMWWRRMCSRWICGTCCRIKAVGRAKSLRFYPDIESRRPMWKEYREAREVLGYEADELGCRRGFGLAHPERPEV